RQFCFRQAVELRAHNARRERAAGAMPEVIGDDLHALGRERTRVDEGGERLEDARAETGLVRAARACRDQVDVAVGEGVAVGDPADRPGGALARLDLAHAGERLVVKETLAGEEWRD